MTAEQAQSRLGLDWALVRVAAFHRLAGQPAPETPRPLGSDRAAVRAAWMREELDEFLAASSLVEQSDAIIDLIYFAVGSLVELGVPAEALFDVVHRANMRKFTAEGPRRRPGDGKILKGSDWVPPEEELAKTMTGLATRYQLVVADETSSLQACAQMAAFSLAARGIATWHEDMEMWSMQLPGSSLTSAFAASGVPIVDDFEHISQVDEAIFLDRVIEALATYPAVGFAYERALLSRADTSSSIEFLLASSAGPTEVLVVDPHPASPGPRAINVDHLYRAIKAAGDGLHKFAAARV